jgi:hypothetical protein
MTKVELYAIGTSTTLESNKSQSHNAQAAGHAFSMRTGSVRTAVSPLQAAEVSKDGVFCISPEGVYFSNTTR